jgi:hypothetical protein
MKNKKTARRGVLLLLILSLLAMFGMVAVAFVVLSSQAGRTARLQLHEEQVYHPVKNDLDEAAMTVLRGSHNDGNKIGSQNLLEGVYGNNPISATIDTALANVPTFACGGQLTDISLISTATPAQLSRRVGCVLTITIPSTNAPQVKGLSTRIVGFNPTNNRVQIVAFPNILPANVGNLAGCSVVINDTPFTGTGLGYNTATGSLNQLWDIYNNDYPSGATLPGATAALALLPFSKGNRAPAGGINTDYDAPDYQHMLMATPPLSYTNISGNNFNTVIPSMHRPALVGYWYQQLHDTILPAIDPNYATLTPQDQWTLILQPYGYDNIFNNADDPGAGVEPMTRHFIAAFKRNIIGRPLPEDHPNFTGSNPYVKRDLTIATEWDGVPNPIHVWERGDGAPTQGTANVENHWDVDNDGDGIPDSIWVDIGLPLRSLPDGRKIKPLVAIYCLDLDGRLNLNAHGNLAQADLATIYDPTINAINAGTNYRFAPTGGGLEQTVPALGYLLRGQGIGPAEINLAPIFTVAGDYLNILRGNGVIEGRYGVDGVPGLLNQNYLGWNKYFNLPDNYAAIAGVPYTVGYGTPFDLKGTMAIGLDPRGQPLYQNPAVPMITSNQNIFLPDPAVPASATNPYDGHQATNPYAINLSPKAPKGVSTNVTLAPDSPFSVAELEPVLRPYDRDSKSLPSRLTTLSNTLAASRNLVTTESHDLNSPPAPQVPNSYTIKAGLPISFYPQVDLNDTTGNVTIDDKTWIKTWYPLHTLQDLLTAKYYIDFRHGGDTSTDARNNTIAALTNHLSKLFPPDVLAGMKMDLNRPLGSWQDAAGNFQLYSSPTPPLTNVAFSYGPDGSVNGLIIDPATNIPVPPGEVSLSQQAKQLHARYLYVLMMLLRESGAVNFNELPTGTNKDRLTARRIAQWAINAVDFMTPDSAMTPFEFDYDPFTANGWRVDGRIGTPFYTSTDDALPDRGLVWGCKAPDLIMTENINFHDRRAADTDMDSSKKKRTAATPADPTLDQPQIPQGSTFIEFYCTRNATNPQAPADLYSYVAGQWRLDLGRMAPAWTEAAYNAKFGGATRPNDMKRRYPVWRLVISESRLLNANNDALTRFNDTPNTFTPQTEQIYGEVALPTDMASTTVQTIKIDRIVWFANQKPTTSIDDPTDYHADANRIYYGRGGTNTVPGGEYLVVGPRWVTNIGSKAVQPGAITTTNFWGDPSPQAITLSATGMNFVNTQNVNNYPDATTQIKSPKAMIVGADAPTSWIDPSHAAGTGFNIGLSISEPIPGLGSYYTEPTVVFGGSTFAEWYGQPDDNTTATFRDDPEDSQPNKPLGHEGLLASRTTPNYKTFLLQRLANPSEPFEPSTNPYITVDWMPADLTVFNGMDYMSAASWTASVSDPSWDPNDPDVSRPNPDIYLASRQRGFDNAAVRNNIWQQDYSSPLPRTYHDTAASTLVFPYHMNHSLGYLNIGYWDKTAVEAWNSSWRDWNGVTQIDEVTPSYPLWRDQTSGVGPNTVAASQPWITRYTTDNGTPAGVPTHYYGDPLTPFPWLTWNNRPYISPYELLLVPSSDPGRLFKEMQLNATPATPTKSFEPSNPTEYPFPSLLNFYLSKSIDPAYPTYPPSLYRIFDYLRVPSPFVGEETHANPANAGVTGGPGTHNFHPPFNKIPSYRETGKINLNTIYDQRVFLGLMNSFPGVWDNFLQSRRGYGAASNIVLQANFNVPTDFVRPFRSAANSQLVPPTLDGSGNDTHLLAYDRGITATPLRSRPVNQNPGSPTNENVLFQNTISSPWNDTSRNPYFNYLGTQKFGNLTTTHSNVYAVWITEGYFEATPVNYNSKPAIVHMANVLTWTPQQLQAYFRQIYPDGYEFGQELGSDTGEIERHRGFYIIDRSIPVGFQRGQDLNTEKAFLLKRVIE